jgi:hypothetical protein
MREKIIFMILLFVVCYCRVDRSFPNSFFISIFFLHHRVSNPQPLYPPLARLSRQWYYHCATVPLGGEGLWLFIKGWVVRLLGWGPEDGGWVVGLRKGVGVSLAWWACGLGKGEAEEGGDSMITRWLASERRD